MPILLDYPEKPPLLTVTMKFGTNISPDEVIKRGLAVMENIPWLPVAYGKYESKYDYDSGTVTITFFTGNKYPSEK
jgi:hypothetical protein